MRDLLDFQPHKGKGVYLLTYRRINKQGRNGFTLCLASLAMGHLMVYTGPDYQGNKKFKLFRLQEKFCLHLSVYILKLSSEESPV